MRKTNKILGIFLSAALFFTGFATSRVSAQEEEFSQEQIFELIVKRENWIDQDEDIILEQSHFDNVTKMTTDYEYYVNGQSNDRITLYLTDFSLLEKLNNLEDLRIHVPTEVGAFEYDLNYLNTLPYKTLTVGLGYGADYSEAEVLNLQKNQVAILEGLNPLAPVTVKVAKFGRLNNDFLLGLSLKPNISKLQTVDAEANIRENFSPYEFSHEENGQRIYKTHVQNPFSNYITLDDDGIVVKDERAINTTWYFATYNGEMEPTFYDFDGQKLSLTEGYSEVFAREVASMDVFFTEEKLEEMLLIHHDELRFMAERIYHQEEQMLYYEEQLKIETNPELIAEIEQDIIDLQEYINDLENELSEFKAQGSSFALKVSDFTIEQQGVDASGNHELFASQRFYALLLLNDGDVQTHTVTFESNGGTYVPKMREVAKNNKIIKPDDPKKGTKAFEGWFKEETLENEWDFENDVVTEDITLYAKWDEQIYDVHFDSRGGSPVPSKRVVENERLSKPADPSFDNNTFAGWFTTEELQEEWDFDNNVVVETMTLYAKWDASEEPATRHKVTFNSNKGSEVEPYLNVAHDTLITAPINPTRTGYTFKGWFVDNESFTQEWDFDSNTVTTDLMLHAKWENKETGEEPVVPPAKEPEDKTPPTGLSDKTMLYISIVVLSGIYLGLKKQMKRN